MDPTATFLEFLDLLDRKEFTEASHKITELDVWLNKGGFPPRIDNSDLIKLMYSHLLFKDRDHKLKKEEEQND